MNVWKITTIILTILTVLSWWQVAVLESELYEYDSYLFWYESGVERYTLECEEARQTNLDAATLWMERYYECVEASYG